jgi:Tol biopolymer transport system component
MSFVTARIVTIVGTASSLVAACDTTSPGGNLERPPSLIAFFRDGERSLYTVRPDGSELHLIVRGRRARRSGNLSFNYPTWSPDGQLLAYVRYTGEDPGSVNLEVARWDGSDRKDISGGGRLISELAWAPDGERLAFDRASGGAGSSEFYGGSVLYTAGPRGGEQTPIPRAGPGASLSLACPSWSPDGSRLAFVDRLNTLWTARADGTDLRLVLAGAVLCARWSPDGTRLAFVNDRGVETGGVDPRGEIFLVNPDGSGLRKLTVPPNTEGEPMWSPDGSRLAFQGVHDGVSGLFHMRPDGTDVVHVISDLAIAFQPTWSPDGSQFAFASGFVTQRDIHIINADGTGLRNITNSLEDEYDPNWR